MEQINIFTDGVIGDIDPSFIDNKKLVFPTLNIQLIHVKGKGFVPTSIKGNEVLFDIKSRRWENYTDIQIQGACEYNGVLYMAIKGKNEVDSENIMRKLLNHGAEHLEKLINNKK